MKTPEYDIKSFDYNKEEKLFSERASSLFTINMNSKIPFLNERRKFIIRNQDTGDFRRFTFMFEKAGFYLFQSEDGFFCKIFK